MSLFHKLPLAYLLVFGSLITLLVLSSGPVYAEWEKLGPDDEGSMTVYIDRDTIRLKGDTVKMWALMDRKTAEIVEGHSILSGKFQYEFDCAEERMRILAITFLSGRMGHGNVVGTKHSDNAQWIPVEPGSIGQGLWNFACGKK